jgi:hypothetical protein
VRRFLDVRAERAAGRDRAKAARSAGAACLYGVHCRCSRSLIVKEELNIFSLGLVSVLKTNFSPHTLTERGV